MSLSGEIARFLGRDLVDAIIERFSRFTPRMSLLSAYTLTATGERVLARLDPTPVTLRQLIDTPKLLPFGASFSVNESVTLRLTLTNPALIDVDLQWFAPKFYLGAWEVAEETGTPSSPVTEYPKRDGQVGFISSFNQQLSFSTQYLVRGLSTGNRFERGRLDVNNCNLVMIPRPPSVDPLLPPGFQPGINTGILKGDMSDTEFAVIDRVIPPIAKTLGFFIKPGVTLDAVEHEMSMTRAVFINAMEATTAICRTASDCDSEFDRFVRDNNFGQPIDMPNSVTGYPLIHSTLTRCEATGLLPCTELTYTCSDGGTRIYYLATVV